MTTPNRRRVLDPSPLVLAATTNERQRQELSDILSSAGFRVRHANDERELVELVHSQPPDAIVIDSAIAPPGYALCTTLHTYALVTPIVLIVPDGVSPREEQDGLRAGAWAVLGTPIDANALLLRLAIFIEPKRELDRVSGDSLMDRVSGLYNYLGLSQRAAELAALATRHGLALACAVFRPETQLPNHHTGDRLALAFKRVGRASDALGRIGRAEFAVFGPATNTWAAARLVARLRDHVERAFGILREQHQPVGVRVGYITAPAAQKISPSTLLAHARSALETEEQ